jgi:hypothetical protein
MTSCASLNRFGVVGVRTTTTVAADPAIGAT